MQAYTYVSKGKFELREKSKPVIMHERDAIVKVRLRVSVPVICISSMEVFHVQFRELLLVTRWLELLKKLEVLLLMLNRETE